MRLIIAILVGVCVYHGDCLPRGGRESDGAEVIRVVDEKSPILLSGGDADTVVAASVETRSENGTSSAAVSTAPPTQAAPTPVPDTVAVTTEKLQENTPSLVPTVVDTGANPGGTPPPPANATTTVAPEEGDEEDSEEDGSEEEADEGDEEDEEEEEDEEDEEDADDEEEEDDVAKGKKKRKQRNVAAGEEVALSFKEESDGDKQQQQSEEEDGVESSNTKTVGTVAVVKGGDVVLSGVGNQDKLLAVVGSKLQSLPSSGVTNEDDEVESNGGAGAPKGTGSVVIS